MSELSNQGSGVLYVVATPIGNLQDISLRALEILQAVRVIASEDTRHSLRLLQHFNITVPTISLHEHNERQRIAELITQLKNGDSIALITDAGTPLISDPGFHFVDAAHLAGIKVSPIPGACAAIAALSAAGLATDRFVFEGFLPAKEVGCLKRLEALREEARTMIFYEAPHRILDLVTLMQTVFGPDRPAVLARELTKIFETVHRAPLGQLLEWISQDANQQRGEIVLIVDGKKASAQTEVSTEAVRILKILLAELPVKQAAQLAAKITHGKKNELYQVALSISQSRDLGRGSRSRKPEI